MHLYRKKRANVETSLLRVIFSIFSFDSGFTNYYLFIIVISRFFLHFIINITTFSPSPPVAKPFLWVCLFPLCCRSVNTIWQQSERDWFIENNTAARAETRLGFQYNNFHFHFNSLKMVFCILYTLSSEYIYLYII